MIMVLFEIFLPIIKWSNGDLIQVCCQNISLYEPEQSLSLSQDEGRERCWGVP